MEKQCIIPEGVDATKLVYTPAVKAGGFVYASGALGVKDGKLVGPDAEAQARQAMENLGRVLQSAGSSWDKVVKVTCFLADGTRDFGAWNKVWKEFFPTNPPARSTVGAGMVLQGALVEIDLIALA